MDRKDKTYFEQKMSVMPSLFAEIERQIITGPIPPIQPDTNEAKNVTSATNEKTFKCLFRASSPEELAYFHASCDNKGPTLTVLYGKGNVIFGGYTSRNWASGKMLIKEDPHAFLFHKAENETSPCVFHRVSADNKSKAIVCDTDFGPTFGVRGKVFNSYDLQTFTISGMNKKKMSGDVLQLNGMINMNYTYKNEQVLLKKTEINGGTLDVHQIEVYQVVDDSMPDSWRQKPENIKDMKDYLINFDPFRSFGIDYLNILLLGVIGSGKSSFVNTLATVFAEEVVTPAVAMGGDRSVTNEVFSYKLKTKNGRQLRINIIDIRGYDKERELDEELKHILSGRLKTGYKFPPTFTAINSGFLVENPTMEQKIHIVCLVVDAQKFELQQQTPMLIKGKEKVMEALLECDIQTVSVVVKLDERCPRIFADVDHVYKSPKAKNTVDGIAQYLGLPEKRVFPVVNYVNDKEISGKKDALALQALYEMVKLAENFIPHHINEDPRQVEKDPWSSRGKLFTEMNNEQIRAEMETYERTAMRFLCVGSVNSGKTCFIDSVSSSLSQEICNKAGGGIVQQAAAYSQSRTEKFRLFHLWFKNSSNRLQKTQLLFGDMPGFQNEGGIQWSHVRKVIEGCVPDNFKIKGGITPEDEKKLTNPDDTKKIAAVCLVFDVLSVGDLSEKVTNQYKELINWLISNDIPYIVVLTKVDQLCPTIRSNTCEVFKSQVVKENKALLRSRFGFSDSKLFPVRNYVHEREVVPAMDALLLDAFREMVKLGWQYLEESKENAHSVTFDTTDE